MPSPFDLPAMRFDNADQSPDFAGAEAIVLGQSDVGKQPELCIDIGFSNMNMDRLARCSLKGVEMEPHPFESEHYRHQVSSNLA